MGLNASSPSNISLSLHGSRDESRVRQYDPHQAPLKWKYIISSLYLVVL